MSVFHQIQDIYDDALRLHEELGRIPSRCDCEDGTAQLSGECCCAKASRPRQSEGCLSHLEQLKKRITWFKEDTLRERRQLDPGELSPDAEGRLSLIINLIENLDSSTRQIETDIKEFQSRCAHAALDRLKNRGAELARHIAELNRLI